MALELKISIQKVDKKLYGLFSHQIQKLCLNTKLIIFNAYFSQLEKYKNAEKVNIKRVFFSINTTVFPHYQLV